MQFDFSPEHELFRKTVREFCKREITPYSRQMERDGRMPDSIIRGLSKMGLFGLAVPSEYGGSGADAISAGIAGEEIGYADLSCATAVLYLVPVAWGYILSKYGSPELRKRTLPNITSGKAFLGIAATEPGAGSDLANMTTVAKRVGDGYVLNGEKMYISGIKEAKNQMSDGSGYLTLAKTDPESGTRGMSFFFVPFEDTEGLSTSYLEEMGRRGMSAGGFLMRDLRVPAENRLGVENKGFYYAMEGFDFARSIIAAVCCGAAMGALDMGLEYIKQRKAFQQPIARFEGVQFKLAEDYARVDASRLLAYRALWMYDQEQRRGRFKRFEVTKAVAEAKMLAPVTAFETINDVLQWFGAFGYTLECPIEMGLRGVRSYMLAEGSTEIMKIIVARELLGKEFLATP
ncbi:MAG TPA: acyl-CoA dehydrogenase family protein [archaeon]|nr:acyl-CoA dehydrogenase family protein [archaeon]